MKVYFHQAQLWKTKETLDIIYFIHSLLEKSMLRLLPLFIGSACYSANKSPPIISSVDNDGDGYTQEEDCDDQNPAVFYGAEEICDGLDNNCDDIIDNDLLLQV